MDVSDGLISDMSKLINMQKLSFELCIEIFGDFNLDDFNNCYEIINKYNVEEVK